MFDPAAFADLPVPTVIACLAKLGLRTRHFTGLRPLDTTQPRLCGTAFTIRTIPVREDLRDSPPAGTPNLHRQAMAAAGAGQVVVIDARDHAGLSPLGDIIALALQQRGVRGVISDSGVSDAPAIAALGFPIFCHGSGPVPASARIVVADWNLPIGCAGVAVYPGDLILGDASGAVCVPWDLVPQVATMAAEKEELEGFLVERIRAGFPLEGTYPPDAATQAAFEAWKRTR